jgi:hypothetical protein
VDPETATLTVTVWDEEQGWQDLIIGKIEIPIPGIKTFASPEQWHTLTFADSKGYVSGDIHLKVRYHPPTIIANGSLFIKGQSVTPLNAPSSFPPHLISLLSIFSCGSTQSSE